MSTADDVGLLAQTFLTALALRNIGYGRDCHERLVVGVVNKSPAIVKDTFPTRFDMVNT